MHTGPQGGMVKPSRREVVRIPRWVALALALVVGIIIFAVLPMRMPIPDLVDVPRADTDHWARRGELMI